MKNNCLYILFFATFILVAACKEKQEDICEGDEICQAKLHLIGKWAQINNCFAISYQDTLEFYDNNTFKSKRFSNEYRFAAPDTISFGNSHYPRYHFFFSNDYTVLLIEAFQPDFLVENFCTGIYKKIQ